MSGQFDEEGARLLDRIDWPSVGDEVLYHQGSTGRWVPAIVRAVAEHDGDLRLDVGDGVDALDVKHGPQRHGWLLYGEPVTAPAEQHDQVQP